MDGGKRGSFRLILCEPSVTLEGREAENVHELTTWADAGLRASGPAGFAQGESDHICEQHPQVEGS